MSHRSVAVQDRPSVDILRKIYARPPKIARCTSSGTFRAVVQNTVARVAVRYYRARDGWMHHAQCRLRKQGGNPMMSYFARSWRAVTAMVDLITAIGDDAGFKVDVQATPFAALIPSLTSNKIDIIAAAMLITDQR